MFHKRTGKLVLLLLLLFAVAVMVFVLDIVDI